MSLWKRLFLIAILAVSALSLSAQQRCGFDEVLAHQKKQHPDFSTRALLLEQLAFEEWMNRGSTAVDTRNSCEVFTIPVVFHLVYANQAANISTEQILSQLDILNQDYRRMDSTAGSGPGVDTRIQFCLATLDPNGDSTTGISRTQSTLGIHRTTEEDQLKSLVSWDDQRYLNIWVVESATLIDPNGQDPPSAILAYASFPTLPNGLPQGVVIDHRYLGNQGTAVAPYNAGRTLTHEIGHFLGLYHPFESDGICSGASESNCISNGDRICDTPSQLDPTYGCPIVAGNSCIDRPCDGPDPAFNYMNYTDDACMNAFTAGQADRLRFFLEGARASLVDPLNLISTGCGTANLINRPTANFSQSSISLCIEESVVFQDLSEGCPDTYTWSFPGGIPSSSASTQPVVTYSVPGTYPVTLVVGNSRGNDTITRLTAIRTSVAVQAGTWQENFESILFPPEGWQKGDEDELGGWIRTNQTARSGQFSAVMPHFDSPSCGFQDMLISPPLEMSGKPWELSFSYAYQQRNTESSDADEFQVSVSDTCGAPWLPVFFRAGASLATVEGTLDTGPFVPGSGEWKQVVIDLSQFSDRSHARIRFQTRGRNGQNLYLDDIRMSPSTFVSVVPEVSGLEVFPNPFGEDLTIRHPAWAGQEVELELLDMQGRVVEEVIVSLNVSGETIWNVKQPTGLYIVRVSHQHLQVVKLVVRE